MTMVFHPVTMPFRRGYSSKRPVNSVKHIVDTFGELAGAVDSGNIFATTVPNTDSVTFNPVSVRMGATVNAFFISLFIIGATGAPLNGPLDWFLIKTHTGQAAQVPSPGATGTSNLRNQIIHEEKGLAGSGDGTAMAFKGVVMIPRGMRRFREGDNWRIVIRSEDTTNNAQFCLKVIYKSYF